MRWRHDEESAGFSQRLSGRDLGCCGITEAAIVLNPVAASGAAMNGSSAIHLTMFGLNPVVKFGNDRLKSSFLHCAATGDLHVAFGVAEPDAGTDTSRISTRATEDGMGHWTIRVRKRSGPPRQWSPRSCSSSCAP